MVNIFSQNIKNLEKPDVAGNTCAPCHTTCEDCNGDLETNCLKCLGTLYLDGTTCKDTVISGFFSTK